MMYSPGAPSPPLPSPPTYGPALRVPLFPPCPSPQNGDHLELIAMEDWTKLRDYVRSRIAA